MSDLHLRLVALLDADAKERRRIVEGFSAPELSSRLMMGVLRRLLATDADVAVRAAAAEALGRWKLPSRFIDDSWPAESDEKKKERVCDALLAAVDDVSPVVRDAAIRALARRRARSAFDVLSERADGDLVWWVRRAALYALGVIAGTSPGGAASGEVVAEPIVTQVIEAARAALTDPFWRVRHAAVQVLAVLGRQEPERRGDILADVEGGSADYLRALWGPTLVEDPTAPAVTSRLPEALADRDPAVVTARLAEMPDPPALALVELLCDPHVPLRELAVRRLLELEDREAFAAALRWLDEPRIPHVATTVIEMLDGLGDPARELAEQVLAGPSRIGASRWAIGWVVALRDEALADRAWQRALEIGEPELALPYAPETFLVEILCAEAAGSRPSRLSLAAADELLQRPSAQQQRVLEQLPLALPHEIAARLVAFAPLDSARMRAAVEWKAPDAVQAVALARLGPAAPRTGIDNADPFVRHAVSSFDDLEDLYGIYLFELDPWVRRSKGRQLAAEIRRALRAGHRPARLEDAVCILSLDWDPLLRVEAISLLDPQRPAELNRLLEMISDPSPVVQAALFEPLAALSNEIIANARASAPPEVVQSIDLWLRAMEPNPAAPNPGEAFSFHNQPAISSAGDACEESSDDIADSSPETSAPRTVAAVEPIARRSLGRTGLTFGPLCISGAFDLSSGSLYAAVDAGVDAFFWEPTYPTMARFLRNPSLRDRTKVITGSYHADAASIEKDVHRALRRLRRDTLDVFLLFWARSSARLDEEAYAILERLQKAGHIRATGFSTHDRSLAMAALDRSPWDVVMTRHSAAHPGIEAELLPHAIARGASVLTFSALCYGRMVSGPNAPSPADCYRYSLSQSGVSACISAPRRHRELVENLEVLRSPTLEEEQLSALRRHGEGVRLENQRFGSLIRQPTRDAAAAAMSLLEAALPPEEDVSTAKPTAASLGRSLTARNPSRRLRRGRL